MKKTVQLVAAIVATSILSSYGGGGDSISEVNLIPVKSGKEFQYIDNLRPPKMPSPPLPSLRGLSPKQSSNY